MACAALSGRQGRIGPRHLQASPETVEPVFGVIKAVLGFAGFSLRGLERPHAALDGRTPAEAY